MLTGAVENKKTVKYRWSKNNNSSTMVKDNVERRIMQKKFLIKYSTFSQYLIILCRVYTGCFDIGIQVYRKLIWTCPNLILSKIKTTSKQNLGSPLCYNLFGYKDNLDPFFTIDIYILAIMLTLSFCINLCFLRHIPFV